jgi:gliding motility-associated-like protein
MIREKYFARFLLFFLIAGFSLQTKSQEVFKNQAAKELYKEAAIVRNSNYSILPSYIKFETPIPTSALIPWLKENFNLDPNIGFSLINTEKDEIGFTHDRYRQTFHNKPIEAATLIIHSKDNSIKSLNGLFYDKIPNNEIIGVTELEALDKAITFVGASQYKWELPEEEEHLKWESNNDSATYFPKGELVYYSKGLTFTKESYKLAYKFNIYAQTPLYRAHVYVDAENGEILGENAIIHHADTPGTAETVYSGTRAIIADSFGGGFRLRDGSRGLGIRTFDLNNAYGYGGAVDFVDDDNNWNNVNPQLDEYATDAHWGTEMTYDYFLDEHSRNSIDNAGFQLNSYVHYGVGYVNAFWDGTRMTYGDGDGVSFDPLTSTDIAGHEITHGLTNLTANLIYFAESGALNESFSDIFGTAIENFARPGDWDWLMSDDIGAPFRSLENPNLFGHPDTYFGTFWAPLAGPDNGGVHSNSGVQNFWYYLLVSGGTGVNDIGDAYTVNSLGFDAASAITFRNLTVYLSDASNHADARFFAIQSAIDLFGECSFEEKETTNAWYAVGVGPEYVSTVTAEFSASSGCFPTGEIEFEDLSTTLTGTIDTWEWNFSDGGIATDQNPTYSFSEAGTFPVELTVTNDLGCEDIISFDVNVFDAPDAAFSFDNLCFGETSAFTDESTILTGAISTWEWDFGDGELATTENPTNTYLTEDTFDVKLVVTADNGCKDSLTQALTITPSPTVDFTFANACQDEVVNFTNTSTLPGEVLSDFLWNFGDGTTSTEISPNHSYTDAGVYNVNLIVTSASGCSNSTNYDISIFSNPEVNFSLSNHCESEITSFEDLSTIALPELITTQTWSFGDGTSGTGSPVTHEYSLSGTYNVSLEVTSVNGCSASLDLPIIVFPKPISDFTIDGNSCINGGPVIFNNSSSISDSSPLTYNWNFDDGAVSILENPSHTYTSTGAYDISLTVESENGCTSIKTMPFSIFEKPNANFTSTDPNICSPNCIDFINTSSSPTTTITTTRWQFSDGQSSSNENPSPCFSEATAANSYDVQLIVENTFGCKDTLSVNDYINVSPTPVADFNYGPERIDILYPEVTFSNKTINGHSYSWDFGDYSSFSNQTNPTHTYSDIADVYRVILTAYSEDGSCSSFAEKLIRVEDVVIFYVPNAFTPDGDTFNEAFKPVFKSGYDPYDYHLTIFNRWGEKVFESYDAAYGWDGYYGEKGLANSGVYVWVIEFKESMSDKRRTESGHFTILR